MRILKEINYILTLWSGGPRVQFTCAKVTLPRGINFITFNHFYNFSQLTFIFNSRTNIVSKIKLVSSLYIIDTCSTSERKLKWLQIQWTNIYIQNIRKKGFFEQCLWKLHYLNNLLFLTYYIIYAIIKFCIHFNYSKITHY